MQSLGKKLAITIFVFMSLLTIILTSVTYDYARKYLEENQEIRVKHLLNAINYTTERVSAEQELIRIINLFGAERDVRLIVLAMGEPLKVVASSRSKWLGLPVNQLPNHIRTEVYKIVDQKSFIVLGKEQNDDHASYGQAMMISQGEYGEKFRNGAILLEMDTSMLKFSKQQVGIFIFAMMVIFSVAIFGLLYFLLQKLVLKPVMGIVNAMHLRAKGKKDVFAPMCNSDDEISQISKVLNYMLYTQDNWQKEILTGRDQLEEYLSVTGAIIVNLDSDGRVKLINKYGCKLLGYTESEILNENWFNIVFTNDKKQEARKQFQELLHKGINNDEVIQFENEVVTKSGEKLYVNWRCRVSGNNNSARSSVLFAGIDITNRKQMELQLIHSENRLLVSQKIAHIGSWEWNIETGELTWTDEIYRIFGQKPQEYTPTYEKFVQMVHPEDRDSVIQAVNASVANADTPYAIAHRIELQNGEIRHVNEMGQVYRNEQGTPTRMIGAVLDITNAKKVEQELMRTHDELEKRVEERTADLKLAESEATTANKSKSDFLARMSHELRTPLNAILGFSQLLERDTLTPSQTKAVAEISQGGHHLLELINDILDLSRIDTDNLSVSLEPISVNKAFFECLSLVAPLVDQKKISVVTDGLKLDNRQILADPTRLKQVLINLLSNAIKFNREKGSIIISYEASSSPDCTRLVVRDTGFGISKDNIEKLFMPFERLGLGLDSVEGAGIGLALTKKLLQVMGGRIGVESKTGIGSAFWIELPTVEYQPDTLPVAVRQETHAYQILYIEDSPSNLKLVERLMDHRPEIKLLTASRPELGLQLASVYQPDLILLDINLPGMDGFEVLARIQTDPEITNTTVIALSANAMKEHIARSMEAGFAEYLTKPLDVSRFFSILDSYLPPSTKSKAG